MLALSNSDSVGTDFHILWKQAQFAGNNQSHVQLFQNDHSSAICLRIMGESRDDFASVEVLLHHVHLLLEAPSGDRRQLKGALKLVRLFAKCVRYPAGENVQRQNVLLNDCTISEMMLLEKLAEQDPSHKSPLQLACEYGCFSYVMGQVSSEVSLLHDVTDEYSLVVIGHLILQQNVLVFQKMMMDPLLRTRVCRQFIESDVRDEDVLQRLVDGLWSIFEQNVAQQGNVLLVYSSLLGGNTPFLGRKIGEKVQALRKTLHPFDVVEGGRTYSDIFSMRGSVQSDGFISVFLGRRIEESSREDVCLKFMKLTRIKALIPQAVRSQLPQYFNVVEAAIWLKVSPDQLSGIISCYEFEMEIEKLRGKIPDALLEQYLLSAWKVDRQHLQEVCFEPPALPPQGVTIQNVLSQYESLVPASGMVQIGGKSCVIPRASLQLFIGRIQRKEFFIGTPRAASPQLQEYYGLLDSYICHTIALLQIKGERESWLRCLKEYADAADHCGGRYFATVMAEYFIASSQGNTSKEKILRSLAQLRRVWFEQTILNSSLDHNPNPLNRALRKYGVLYGVPGGRAAQHFDDPYGRLIAKGEVESSFTRAYTPSAMVQWLQEAAREAEMMEALMGYYKEHPPLGWRAEFYQGLQKRVDEILSLSQPELQKTELLEACLGAGEIELQQGKSPQESIVEAQKYDFLGHYFFDAENKIRTAALLHILTDMKALSTPFSQVDFLWPEENRKTEGLVDLMQRVGSLVLSWFR